MSFNGPFLVRQEQGYWVASLPVSDVVSFSGTDTFDWRAMLTEMKKYVREYEKPLQKDPRSRLHQFMSYDTGDSPEEIDKARAKMIRAQKDPNPSVQIGAEKTLKKIDMAMGTNQ